jgi:hypothetical protein
MLVQDIYQVFHGNDGSAMNRKSKRNYASRNKTALGTRGQAEISRKIEDLRFNKSHW